MSEYQFSAFKNIMEVSKPHLTTVKAVYNTIKGERYKEIVEKIRGEKDKKKRNDLKSKLASITFSGVFSQRKISGLTQHSGLLCIDFDDLGDQYEVLREKLITDEHTHLLFRSPSGNGLKAVVKIPANMETHAFSCRAMVDYYDIPNLDNFEDVCRVCYASYDPDCYFNPDSKVFAEVKYPKAVEVKAPSYITDDGLIFRNIEKWLVHTKGIYYTDGSKHNYLIRFAYALCRYGVQEESAVRMAIEQYQGAASYVESEDFERIFKKAYQKFSSSFGTVYFDLSDQTRDRASNNVEEPMTKEMLEIEAPPRDVIRCNDIWDEIMYDYTSGDASGETTHYAEVDKHWKWKRGEVTLVTGIGNHGKTSWVMNMCMIKSIREGYKWSIFSPEQNPPVDFYNELIQMYIGKPTQLRFKNRMTEKELREGADFIHEHFFFVYPKKNKHTPEYINERHAENIVKLGAIGCIKDPFNKLLHDGSAGMRDDQYLAKFLTQECQFASDGNIFDITIAHPKSMSGKKTKDNDYERPDVFDLNGGAMWNNMAHNILCVHRPFRNSQPESNIVEFESQKIKKQRLVGVPGKIELTYNAYQGRYYYNGQSPFDAHSIVRSELVDQEANQIVHYDEPPF